VIDSKEGDFMLNVLKRKVSKFLIIGLAITLIIVSSKYRSLIEEHKLQQTNMDNVFKIQLRNARVALSDESLTVENDKNYYAAISKIEAAVELFPYTTFAKNNDGLMRTLDDNLCNLMKQEKYKEAVILESKLIKEYLSQLSYNPEDKQATDNLNELTKKIR
jgi:hypothetical protein